MELGRANRAFRPLPPGNALRLRGRPGKGGLARLKTAGLLPHSPWDISLSLSREEERDDSRGRFRACLESVSAVIRSSGFRCVPRRQRHTNAFPAVPALRISLLSLRFFPKFRRMQRHAKKAPASPTGLAGLDKLSRPTEHGQAPCSSPQYRRAIVSRPLHSHLQRLPMNAACYMAGQLAMHCLGLRERHDTRPPRA